MKLNPKQDIKNIKPGHLFLLFAVVLSAYIYQPTWVYNNFWARADFYSSIPFRVPYFVYLTVYALFSVVAMEIFVRFVKRFA